MESVAVVMTMFNGGKFLSQTFETILSQTTAPEEVIIIDDASTDDSVAIAENARLAMTTRKEIIALDKNSGGPVLPTNIGVNKVSAKWIAFLDQDDLWDKERLSRLLQALHAVPSCRAIFNLSLSLLPSNEHERIASADRRQFEALLKNKKTENVFQIDGHDLTYWLVMKSNIVHTASALIVDADLCKRIELDRSLTICWDVDFLIKICKETDILFYDEHLTYHRVHQSGLSRMSTREAREMNSIRTRLLLECQVLLDKIALKEKVAKYWLDSAYENAVARSFRGLALALRQAGRFGVPPSRLFVLLFKGAGRIVSSYFVAR